MFMGYISKNSCFSFGQLMIHINSRIDERIAQYFPNDPYSNLCIVTSTQRLYLQHAFLSMDSAYFSRIDPDASQVKLVQLQQVPLLKVLHALYGASLVSSGVEELDSLLSIIDYLEIQQYRKNIEEGINKQEGILQSVEFIGVSYKHRLMWKEVLHFHVENGLQVLANEKSFLQLAKISQDAFKELMVGFVLEKGSEGERMINRAMENYFNRKGIRPMVFLAQNNLQFLRAIWMKYHHVMQSQPVKQGKNRSIMQEKLIILSQLQEHNKKADLQIQGLTLKITKLRQDLGLPTPNPKFSLLVQPQTQLPEELPLSRAKSSLKGQNNYSSQFKSCIYTTKNPQKSTGGKILNRFGAKNLKRWT